MDDRCESLRDLGDGNVLRCDRNHGHDGDHERWLMFAVWRWDEAGAVRKPERTQIEREAVA